MGIFDNTDSIDCGGRSTLCPPYICLSRREADREADAPTDTAATGTPEDEEEECCGMHITCEKDSLLAGISKSIEYYEDEELDAYKGRGLTGIRRRRPSSSAMCCLPFA